MYSSNPIEAFVNFLRGSHQANKCQSLLLNLDLDVNRHSHLSKILGLLLATAFIMRPPHGATV